MKNFLKQFLKYYLKYITKFVIFIHKPTIIVVAGSINKPFVKQEIKKVLIEQGLTVRANPKNFNTEIGLPLAVLTLDSGYNSYKDWLPTIFKAPFQIFQKNFPKFLVLSLGTSEPGDMKYLLSIIKPHIAIITDITQRYLETFNNIDDLFQEYTMLAKIIPKNGLFITNNDNSRVKELKKNTKAQSISFGINHKADYTAINIKKTINGQAFDVVYSDTKKNLSINKFGNHNIYSAMIGLIIKQHVGK